MFVWLLISKLKPTEPLLMKACTNVICIFLELASCIPWCQFLNLQWLGTRLIVFKHGYFCSVAKSCPTLCDPYELWHARLPCPLLSPGVCSDSCHWIYWGLSRRQSNNLRWSFNFKTFHLYLGSISSCLVLCEHGEQINIITILIRTDVSLSKRTNSQQDPPPPQTYWGSTLPHTVSWSIDTRLQWTRWKSLSRVWLFETSWTIPRQAPQSMEFSRPEYCSG